MLDEEPTRGLITVVERGNGALLLGARKGRRQCVAAADVKNRRRLYPKDRQDPFVYKHDLWLAKHNSVSFQNSTPRQRRIMRQEQLAREFVF